MVEGLSARLVETGIRADRPSGLRPSGRSAPTELFCGTADLGTRTASDLLFRYPAGDAGHTGRGSLVKWVGPTNRLVDLRRIGEDFDEFSI